MCLATDVSLNADPGLTNLVEFYPTIQKETAKPENAHSLGPMQGGSKKQKTVMLLLTHLCKLVTKQIWLDSV